MLKNIKKIIAFNASSVVSLTEKNHVYMCTQNIYLIFEQRNIRVDDIMKIFSKIKSKNWFVFDSLGYKKSNKKKLVSSTYVPRFYVSNISTWRVLYTFIIKLQDTFFKGIKILAYKQIFIEFVMLIHHNDSILRFFMGKEL